LNVHLIDGTYELFRHFYGLRRITKIDRPFGAVVGVLNTVLEMIEEGATHDRASVQTISDAEDGCARTLERRRTQVDRSYDEIRGMVRTHGGQANCPCVEGGGRLATLA
jgi:hypothetical protein